MNGLLKIGKGRISGCSVSGNDIIVIISDGGALRKYIVSPSREVTDCGIVSYARDRYEFAHGILTYDKEVKFEREV